MFDKVYIDSFPVKYVFCNKINDVTNELLQFANNRGDDDNAIKNRQRIARFILNYNQEIKHIKTDTKVYFPHLKRFSY